MNLERVALLRIVIKRTTLVRFHFHPSLCMLFTMILRNAILWWRIRVIGWNQICRPACTLQHKEMVLKNASVSTNAPSTRSLPPKSCSCPSAKSYTHDPKATSTVIRIIFCPFILTPMIVAPSIRLNSRVLECVANLD